MRDFITICENYSPHRSDEFFHASRSPLKVGTVLEARNGSGFDVEIEDMLEQYRPAHCFDRRKSVFVVNEIRALDTVIAYYDYLYVVEVHGELQRYDAVWLNRLWSGLAQQDNDIEFDESEKVSYINGYWSGARCPRLHGEQTAWEFLCHSATVAEEIED